MGLGWWGGRLTGGGDRDASGEESGNAESLEHNLGGMLLAAEQEEGVWLSAQRIVPFRRPPPPAQAKQTIK